MPDLKAQTITLHEGDKTALQYLGAAVVLQWSSLPDDVRKAILTTGGCGRRTAVGVRPA